MCNVNKLQANKIQKKKCDEENDEEKEATSNKTCEKYLKTVNFCLLHFAQFFRFILFHIFSILFQIEFQNIKKNQQMADEWIISGAPNKFSFNETFVLCPRHNCFLVQQFSFFISFVNLFKCDERGRMAKQTCFLPLFKASAKEGTFAIQSIELHQTHDTIVNFNDEISRAKKIRDEKYGERFAHSSSFSRISLMSSFVLNIISWRFIVAVSQTSNNFFFRFFSFASSLRQFLSFSLVFVVKRSRNWME